MSAINQRVVIGHCAPQFLTPEDLTYVFPAGNQIWKDGNNQPDKLLSFLDKQICSGTPTGLNVAMAALTPTLEGITLFFYYLSKINNCLLIIGCLATDILFIRYSGLREAADSVNRLVSDHLVANWSRCANVVATDFFLGNNNVEKAISINKKRFSDSYLNFNLKV